MPSRPEDVVLLGEKEYVEPAVTPSGPLPHPSLRGMYSYVPIQAAIDGSVSTLRSVSIDSNPGSVFAVTPSGHVSASTAGDVEVNVTVSVGVLAGAGTNEVEVWLERDQGSGFVAVHGARGYYST